MSKYLVKVVETDEYGYGSPDYGWIPAVTYSQIHGCLETADRDFVEQEECDLGHVTIEPIKENEE